MHACSATCAEPTPTRPGGSLLACVKGMCQGLGTVWRVRRGVQEKPEDVPTGELPRTVMLVTDRHCCNKVTPGTRVTVLGIYATYRVSTHACLQLGGGGSRTLHL